MEAIGMMFLTLFFCIFQAYAIAAILVIVAVIGLILKLPITRRQVRVALIATSLILLISMI